MAEATLTESCIYSSEVKPVNITWSIYFVVRKSLWKKAEASAKQDCPEVVYKKPMGFTILQTSGFHLCRESSLPPPFLLLAAACSHPSPALLPAPAMLPLGNTPKLQTAEDNVIYESLRSTDSWRKPHSLFIHPQLQQRQNRLNTCRLRKTAQPHCRRSL